MDGWIKLLDKIAEISQIIKLFKKSLISHSSHSAFAYI